MNESCRKIVESTDTYSLHLSDLKKGQTVRKNGWKDKYVVTKKTKKWVKLETVACQVGHEETITYYQPDKIPVVWDESEKLYVVMKD